MTVQTTNGHVVLRDFFTRKAQRDWESVCMKGKSLPYTDGDSVSIPVVDFRLAQEGLVLNMVLSAWEKKGDGLVQVDLSNPQGWIDDLPEQDYQKILEQVLAIKQQKEDDAKKS